MDTISIVGGGIAGLALASRLDPDRFEVTLHEQRAELPVAGTSLAMWPDAQAALAALGVLDPLRSVGIPIDHFPMWSEAGRRLADLSAEGMVVSRHELLSALDAVVPDSVRRVTERVDDVDRLGATVVVGADGVHSAVRRGRWGSRSDARVTPVLAVRGVVADELPEHALGEYWGRGQLFGLGPHNEGTNWYTAFRSDLGPRHVDAGDALDIARARHADAAPQIRRVLASAAPETTLAQRIWTTPRLSSYVRADAALVGDAAHAMTPNLGRGACEALIDAVTLGDLLGRMSPDAALAAYDRARCRRTQRLRAASSVLGRVALAERLQPLRDRLVATVGRRSLVGRRDVPAEASARMTG
ncbi:2-polyprenyl-6-methoxyphenol hydroxylase-like FAD-dependent oxidoreductase [Agromyces ramosus]|uniref:2-polyprenyl-6-methoxyphenol hydroxylase-like FAD-dependent oxidoreductase n=1 Tax=Agromyces ramosus TaxID=33879 RepID=A0A4Q7M7Z7_9MICO|nr:NAD(P)/FAD-dependent oxidoreductase [Agromyces ramosus]RZS64195.1 2-polyprenyl-6-methoxyphenol hydroxylase-like FAD-dependent oxidoreductase [Agromyces ramosus]